MEHQPDTDTGKSDASGGKKPSWQPIVAGIILIVLGLLRLIPVAARVGRLYLLKDNGKVVEGVIHGFGKGGGTGPCWVEYAFIPPGQKPKPKQPKKPPETDAEAFLEMLGVNEVLDRMAGDEMDPRSKRYVGLKGVAMVPFEYYDSARKGEKVAVTWIVGSRDHHTIEAMTWGRMMWPVYASWMNVLSGSFSVLFGLLLATGVIGRVLLKLRKLLGKEDAQLASQSEDPEPPPHE